MGTRPSADAIVSLVCLKDCLKSDGLIDLCTTFPWDQEQRTSHRYFQGTFPLSRIGRSSASTIGSQKSSGQSPDERHKGREREREETLTRRGERRWRTWSATARPRRRGRRSPGRPLPRGKSVGAHADAAGPLPSFLRLPFSSNNANTPDPFCVLSQENFQDRVRQGQARGGRRGGECSRSPFAANRQSRSDTPTQPSAFFSIRPLVPPHRRP